MSSTPQNQITETAIEASNAPLENPNHTNELTYRQILLCAAAIGIACGLVSSAYHYALDGGLHLMWHTLPEFVEPYFPSGFPSWHYVWIATTIGGFLVGLTLHLMGLTAEVAMLVDQVHDPGRLDLRQTPAMIVTSLISISVGGSAGSETPLVQINGSMGSWLSHKLNLTPTTTRVLTFCGMSAALGAFFGTPIGGAIFALEFPHRRGLEYYEAITPPMISSIISFFVFEWSTGLTIGGLYHFTDIPKLSLLNLGQGAFLGLVGGLLAIIFIFVFRSIGYLTKRLENHKIILATLGGFVIGMIALAFPQTLIFGQKEIQTLFDTGSELGVTMLVAIAFAKILAISCTVNSGFRGGVIFPLFYVGACSWLGNFSGYSPNSPDNSNALHDGSDECSGNENANQYQCNSERAF